MRKKSMKASSASCGSSPIPYDLNMDDSLTESIIIDSNIDKVSDDAEDSPNLADHPISQLPLSPKIPAPLSPVAAPTTPTAALAATAVEPVSPAAPLPIAAPDTTAATVPSPPVLQMERKPPSRVDSMKKKPPLPPTYSREGSIKKPKPIPTTPTTTTTITTTTTTMTTTTTRDRKPAKVNNSKVRLYSLIVLGLLVAVVLWRIYSAMATEPSDIDPEPLTDVVVTGGDEL